MNVKEYLSMSHRTITSLAKELCIDRVTLSKYINKKQKVPEIVKFAIAYVTLKRVKPDDWTDD
jgi:DNA transposition AAA+ family ATPase